MNTDKQRVGIAEACGWRIKQIHETTFVYPPGSPVGNGYLGALPDSPEILGLLPDYLADLNAMHEAEMALSDTTRMSYINNLAIATGGNEWSKWPTATATAAQRAEAFLKTLNLWEE